MTMLLFCTWPITAQNGQLEFDEQKWPLHTVVHYSKSNWDGSNKGFVSVYFKENQWIESLKWHEGHRQATVVPAKINPETFNVSHFKNFRCQEGACNQLGDMYWDEAIKGFVLQVGEFRDTVTNIPSYWHSYDFDFASLMTAFLFKKESTDHQFYRADFQELEGKFIFGPIGLIGMTYLKTTSINDVNCHLYQINGPGLHQKGGEIWFDEENMLLRGFKIELPDESSYNNVDFQYLGQEQMNPAQWEKFKNQKWNY